MEPAAAITTSDTAAASTIAAAASTDSGGIGGEVVVLEVPVKDPSFDFTKAVCSHGLFMMAPNHWDPVSRTLNRPLYLSSAVAGSPMVRISHPRPCGSVVVSVAGAASLSSEDEQALLAQVRRMLRLSDDNDRMIQEFHRVHADSRERGFGRIFRSPTLFEDMVKCILLCNCQWPRTLSMAKALCELKLQLKQSCSANDFHPKTPLQREPKRRRTERNKVARNLANKFSEGIGEILDNPDYLNIHDTQLSDLSYQGSCHCSNHSRTFRDAITLSGSGSPPSEANVNFPTPEELAAFDAAFLAKCCKLGYRAQRIVSLARSIVDGTLELRKLEELCEGFSPSSYDSLDQQLSVLSGFGPFTRANVLMCMGFYHRIPADTETVRHIRQFHGRSCNLQSAQKDIEAIYGKYAPFQFLAYWSELWGYYEERFGPWSQMPASSYQLVTASNMKGRISEGLRLKKLELEEQ